MLILPNLFPTALKNNSNKLTWIEGLRGFAAALVSLNHAPLVIINLQYIPKLFVFTEYDFALFQFLGSIGVQIFFCITGLLFAHKLMYNEKIDWSLFFTKRILRIAPAYFFACLFALVITLCSIWPIQNISTTLVNFFELLSFGLLPLPKMDGFDLGRLLGVNWTLGMEWRFYLTLPILFVLFQRFRKFTMIALVGLALGDALWNTASAWVYFVSGALCAPLMYRDSRRSLTILAYIALLLTLSVLIFYWHNYANYKIQRWGIMTVLFASLVILKPKLFTVRWIQAMGVVSYSFYLLHAMTLFAVLSLCHNFIVDITMLSPAFFTLLVGTTLAITTTLSTFSYIYIEKPFMSNARFSHKTTSNRELLMTGNQAEVIGDTHVRV